MKNSHTVQPRILVIDDDVVIRQVLEVVLKRENFMPLLAENGSIGITMAKEQRPDMILLDYIMPVLDGFEVLALLKADEALKGIPVIMFTVFAREENRRLALSLGAIAYLTKPFDINEVVTHIHQQLAARP
jgi:DNA-binding response OmpR family regulator